MSIADDIRSKIEAEFAETDAINVTFDLAKMTNGDHQLGVEYIVN